MLYYFELIREAVANTLQLKGVLHKSFFISAGHLRSKKRTETHNKMQKRANMYKNTLFCTDACNTPVYYTPVSVCPNERGEGIERLKERKREGGERRLEKKASGSSRKQELEGRRSKENFVERGEDKHNINQQV